MEKILYHGSSKIIEKPIFGGGRKDNDYGLGFYCTESEELAKEWACVDSSVIGYANKYALNLNSLNVLDLTNCEYTILNWVAILMKHRQFASINQIASEAKEYIINNFYVDISQYDVVIGYRADDSYFSFAKDFINNTTSVRQLEKAMELGQLGKQVVIISQKGFSNLKFLDSKSADDTYYIKRKVRDEKAKEEYLYGDIRTHSILDDIFVLDIMRRALKHGDKII